jgi:hypothetical protein
LLFRIACSFWENVHSNLEGCDLCGSVDILAGGLAKNKKQIPHPAKTAGFGMTKKEEAPRVGCGAFAKSDWDTGPGYLAFLGAFLSAFLPFFAIHISFCCSGVC